MGISQTPNPSSFLITKLSHYLMVSLNEHIFNIFSFLHQSILGSYYVVQSLGLHTPDNSNVSTAYILPTSLLIASHIPKPPNPLGAIAILSSQLHVSYPKSPWTLPSLPGVPSHVGTYFPWAPCFVWVLLSRADSEGFTHDWIHSFEIFTIYPLCSTLGIREENGV